MNTLLRSLSIATLLGAAACSVSEAEVVLPNGQKVGVALEARPRMQLSQVQAEPRKYFEQTLHVEGVVKDVCQTKGCWMSIVDGGDTTIVRWETGCGGKYAFPTEWSGKRVVVQGSFYPKDLSEADREHMEEEAGKELQMPAELYEMNASAVVLLDSDGDEGHGEHGHDRDDDHEHGHEDSDEGHGDHR